MVVSSFQLRRGTLVLKILLLAVLPLVSSCLRPDKPEPAAEGADANKQVALEVDEKAIRSAVDAALSKWLRGRSSSARNLLRKSHHRRHKTAHAVRGSSALQRRSLQTPAAEAAQDPVVESATAVAAETSGTVEAVAATAAPQLLQTFMLRQFPEKIGDAERDVLNGLYVEHPEARMNQQPIFVGGTANSFFIYYCAREDDWRIGVYLDWGPTLACMCLAFAHTDRAADLLNPDTRTEFPGLQDGQNWHELLDNVPHVGEKSEQAEPPTIPGNGTNPFDPLVVDRTTQCTTTTQAPAVASPSPGAAPSVNVNLNLNLHFGKKTNATTAAPTPAEPTPAPAAPTPETAAPSPEPAAPTPETAAPTQ